MKLWKSDEEHLIETPIPSVDRTWITNDTAQNQHRGVSQ